MDPQKPVATPHDALFKHVFEQPEHAAAELQHVLPAEIVARIDWRTLQVDKDAGVAETLRPWNADLLYSVQLAGRQAFLYVVFEHKSYADPWTAFQLLRYLVRIWERYLQAHPEATRLPPIVPVVVHHSDSGWRSGTELADVVDFEGELRALLASFVPNFRFVLDDLSVQSESALLARTSSALATLALLCLKRARHSGDFPAEFRRWGGAIREVFASRSGAESFLGVMRYIMEVARIPAEQVYEALTDAGVELEIDFMTTWDDIAKLAERNAAEKYLAKGRAEGRAEIVLRQLAARFGQLPAEISDRVRTASPEKLDTWAERLLTASQLEEVFGEG